jgi:hypothetical protein
MKHAIVAQLGARMHYAVPRILNNAGHLNHFYTDICAVKGFSQFLHFIPPSLQTNQIKKFLGRIPQGIPVELITAFTGFGLEYAWRLRRAYTSTEISAVFLWAGDRFNQMIIQCGFRDASVVYGYNSASAMMFETAKKQGLYTVLEQTIAPKSVETLLLDEECSQLGSKQQHSYDLYADEFAAREKNEWAMADAIICGSEFVRQNIISEGGNPDKCLVIPYGIDLSNFSCDSSKNYRRNPVKPLRVLCIGSIGLRKGIIYLLKAMRKLEGLPIQCRIIGKSNVSLDWLSDYIPSNVELVGFIPRSEIAHEYAQADVFCLPSICEGSATVTYEALAAGLPVITTPNSGSIIQDTVEGFIVPIRDPDAIAERLELFMSNPELLEEMSHAAIVRSKYGSIEAYAERLLKVFPSSNDKF